MRNLPLDSANVKSCDRPQGQSSENVIIFGLQTLVWNGLGKSWLVWCCQHRAVAHQSSLITHDRSISATLSRCRCKVLSPQLSKISRMASKSARSVFDFLRLAQSWLRIVAASGVNFSKLWQPKQNFVLASESSASIFSCEERSISNCRVYLTPD